MTRTTTEQYRCSNCGRIHEFTCYHEINITESPQLHEAVLKGKIFDAVCSDCGSKNYIPYPMLYQDEARHFLLFLSNARIQENPLKPVYDFLKEQNDEESSQLLEKLNSYTVRVVSTPNQLSEKILIFEHGLDDRVLEMMKVLMRGEIAQKAPGLKVKGLYYSPRPGRSADAFAIETEDGFDNAVDVYQDLYDGLKNEVLGHIDQKLLSSSAVDEDWAFEAMGYKEKKEPLN